jgi:2-dehydropantoate 2-reductase
MRVVVVGAGGVGGTVGALLAHSGVDVGFVARGQQLKALREHGLRLESPRATVHVQPIDVSDEPSQLAPADVVLVAVKSWQVPEVAPSLAPLLATGGYVVPLENGVGAVPALARALGEERVAGGFCVLVSWLERPGLVRHRGETLRVVVGERRGGGSPRLQALVGALRAAKVDAEIADDVEAALWEKFVFIASFSAVAASARVPAAVVRTVPETRAVLIDAMNEVATLARRRGVRLSEHAVERALAVVDALPADATASMQRDIQAGRPSELEDQVGAVVHLAAEVGLDVPVCRTLFGALLPSEREARRR